MPTTVSESQRPQRPALLAPLDPQVWPEDVPVLIVGGGPVGLSAAMLLAQRGVDVLLVERRGFTSHYPRAHLLNVRTMEIFHEMGVADDIYALAPADDRWRKVAWYTSIFGPTPLHGLKLGDVSAWSGGADAERYAQASPRRFSNLPQIRLDGLLWRHADVACPGRLRSNVELTDVEQRDGAAYATVTERGSGTVHEIRAQYVILADGGRISSELLGVELEGPRAIRDVVSHYVSTDLSGWVEPDALLTHFIQPYGHGGTVGAVQALGPGRYDRTSPEWIIAFTPRPGEPPAQDDDTLMARAREVLGLQPDHPIVLHAVSHWQYEGVIARQFRVGHAFLAGDAAHRHPPTGGLGLNCGVQDAHNLAWKIAAVLNGYAKDSLLDSYESERRPIAAYYTAHALENAGRHTPIGRALGLRPGQTEDEGWNQIGIFVSDTEAGARRRADVAIAVADNAKDYSQLNVEAGFGYALGALVPDGLPASTQPVSPIDFVPTTRPGYHLPHVWLEHSKPGSEPVSTLDLVSTTSFTLFVSPAAADAWSAAAAAAGDGSGCPITVVEVADADRAWAVVREVDDHGAVLVRPDRKVAWRSMHGVEDPVAELSAALNNVLSGGGASTDDAIDPAEPFLQRIRHAANAL